jgi:hypothetical protein
MVLFEGILTIYLVFPPTAETSSVLLQTAPESVLVQLGRCVSEASKLEDVLECHGEHFWTVCPSASKTHVIGSIKVRVVENANEQIVLRNVQRVFAEKKSFTIELTIQVEKRSLIEGLSGSIGSFQQATQPAVVQQADSTIINMSSFMNRQAQADNNNDLYTPPSTAPLIPISSPNDDLGDGLGLYVNEEGYDDEDDMFANLKKNSGNAMRNREHGSKQVFSLDAQRNSPILENKSISPSTRDNSDIEETSGTISPSQNLQETNKEE